jgi:hypothetical protein
LDVQSILARMRDGKGGRQGVVPFSIELRKTLCRYMASNVSRTGLVFFAGEGAMLLARG